MRRLLDRLYYRTWGPVACALVLLASVIAFGPEWLRWVLLVAILVWIGLAVWNWRSRRG